MHIEKFIKGIPDELEVVSIGSSYAKYAYDFSNWKEKGENLAIQPESLYYDRAILKQYSKNLKNNAIVLINLPALVFSFVNYPGEYANAKYYYFLNKRYILNYNWITYLTRLVFPLIRSPRLIQYLWKDDKKDNTLEIIENRYSVEEREKIADIREKDWLQEAKAISLKSSYVAEETLKNFEKTTAILQEMIETCIVSGFRPVIVIPPISKRLKDRFSKDFLSVYLYQNVEQANKKDIPVLNYMNTSSFDNDKLYIHVDFLNKIGREKFMKTLRVDLQKLNYL